MSAAFESFFLPMLAGVSFSLIAVAYRVGQPRGIAPIRMLGVASAVGALVFAILFGQTHLHLYDVPRAVWVWGIVGGVGQYVTIRLFGVALRLGPLSPLWCVVSLAFIPTLAYSGLFLSETLVPLQYVAIATSVLCVIAASIRPAQAETAGPSVSDRSSRRRQDLLYLAVLGTVLVTNSLLAIGQRNLGQMRAGCSAGDFRAYGFVLLAVAYLVLTICVAVDVLRPGQPSKPFGAVIGLGVLLAVGSMGGLGLLNACSTSTIVFAVAGITQIIIVAVVSVLAFGERTSVGWYGTIGLGILSVALANWQQIARSIP